MFELKHTDIPGCYEIQPRLFDDSRGRFVKIFHKDMFKELGLNADYAEEYYSRSLRGVIRGMHFQTPPEDHVKIVYCTKGAVFDVVLDLRVGSPTYGSVQTFRLEAEKGNFVYIPKGLAHGFCALSDNATLVYKVSTVYAPKSDAGIRWNSIGVDWPVQTPIVSDRDQGFKDLSDFESPFIYAE